MNYLADHKLLNQEYNERLQYAAEERRARRLLAQQPGFLHNVGQALAAASQNLQGPGLVQRISSALSAVVSGINGRAIETSTPPHLARNKRIVTTIA